MGRRHREKRTALKAAMRVAGWKAPPGWYENEFGELKKRPSKSEARARIYDSMMFARRWAPVWEKELLDELSRQAREELFAQEDARLFEELDRVSASA